VLYWDSCMPPRCAVWKCSKEKCWHSRKILHSLEICLLQIKGIDMLFTLCTELFSLSEHALINFIHHSFSMLYRLMSRMQKRYLQQKNWKSLSSRRKRRPTVFWRITIAKGKLFVRIWNYKTPNFKAFSSDRN
jgi:hypothetical protein